MATTHQAVTLTGSQVAELNQQLSHMRHEVNNHLALIVAAAEILAHKPELMVRVRSTFVEQPQKISNQVQAFSAQFEAALGIQHEMAPPL